MQKYTPMKKKAFWISAHKKNFHVNSAQKYKLEKPKVRRKELANAILESTIKEPSIATKIEARTANILFLVSRKHIP